MKYDRFKLWMMMMKKLSKTKIHKFHILSVMSLLIDEMIDELKNNEIKIVNFGTFHTKTIKSKKIISVESKEVKISRKSKILRFTLNKKLSNFLSKKIERLNGECEEKPDP